MRNTDETDWLSTQNLIRNSQVYYSTQNYNKLGQSIDIKHLAKYVDRSRQKYKKLLSNTVGKDISIDVINQQVETLTRKEIKDGIQTIQYQVNTLNYIGALISDN